MTIRSPGTGKITVNGEDIRYFADDQSRHQVRVLFISKNKIHK